MNHPAEVTKLAKLEVFRGCYEKCARFELPHPHSMCLMISKVGFKESNNECYFTKQEAGTLKAETALLSVPVGQCNLEVNQ